MRNRDTVTCCIICMDRWQMTVIMKHVVYLIHFSFHVSPSVSPSHNHGSCRGAAAILFLAIGTALNHLRDGLVILLVEKEVQSLSILVFVHLTPACVRALY